MGGFYSNKIEGSKGEPDEMSININDGYLDRLNKAFEERFNEARDIIMTW